MALQLNNWNENRKQEAQFKSTLEQLYTTITYDVEKYLGYSEEYKEKLTYTDSILNFPDSIHRGLLPYNLYWLTYNVDDHTSESMYYAKGLNYNPENRSQKEISKEVLIYLNGLSSYEFKVEERFKHIIQETDVAHPKIRYEVSSERDWDVSDPTYYSDSDFEKLDSLIRTKKFKSILKSLRTLMAYNYFYSENVQKDGLSIRNLIKDYYPEVQVLYKDVGILGNAIDGWEKSTPMTLIDEENSIWDITMFLKEGGVKFRCRDSWAQNWGALEESEFPTGNTARNGNDIPIQEAGNYHIILNLSKNKFEFIKE